MYKSDTGKEDKHQKHPIVERQHKCPECDLSFDYHSELVRHFIDDHKNVR